MDNDEIYWDFTEVNLQFRVKQHYCHHPSFKCPLCDLYKDNLYEEQTRRIFELEDTVRRLMAEYEKLKFKKMKRRKTIMDGEEFIYTCVSCKKKTSVTYDNMCWKCNVKNEKKLLKETK